MKRNLAFLLLAFAFILPVGGQASAATNAAGFSNDLCLGCHSDKNVTMEVAGGSV